MSMAEQPSSTAKRWLFYAIYTGALAFLMLLYLVPISVLPNRIPGPDLMIGITFAVLLRRPHMLPTFLVAALFLFADILFMRPIGLYAALVVLAIELMRSRIGAIREQTFIAEWLMVSFVLLVMAMAYRLVLTAFLVDLAPLGLVFFQLFGTILCYPIIVLLLRWGFGITKLSASEAEAQGRF
jgi:rod shape-determining protein MreD